MEMTVFGTPVASNANVELAAQRLTSKLGLRPFLSSKKADCGIAEFQPVLSDFCYKVCGIHHYSTIQGYVQFNKSYTVFYF